MPELSASTKAGLICVSSLLLGALASDLLAKMLTPKKCNLSCLIVIHTLTFPDQAALVAFMGKWKELADDCFSGVPDCLSCELSIATADNLTCIVFERFARSGHFQNKHNLLDALKIDAKETIGYRQETYVESDLGFMERW